MPTSTLGQVAYTTAGPGLVACSQGQDVAYPAGAPGFQDDPTGASLQSAASQASKACKACRRSRGALSHSPAPEQASVLCMAQGQYGSTVPVSLFGCQLACEAALRCTSLAYNAVLQQCFLKSGAGTHTCTVSFAHLPRSKVGAWCGACSCRARAWQVC